MKKKFLYILLFICSFFFLPGDANAVIDTTTAEIECIYATGVAVGLSYDSSTGALSSYVKEYPVTKSVVIDGDPFSNISLFTCDGTCDQENITPLKNLTCPSEIKVWKVSEGTKEESGDWKTNVKGIYSFKHYYDGDTSKTISSYYGWPDEKNNGTGWWIFGTEATRKTKVIELKSNSTISSSPEVTAPLVAERIYITGDLAASDYSVSYKSSSNEAVGSNNYVQFLKKGSTYYAKRGKTITSISANSGIIGNEYICFKESISEQDSSRSDSSYKFNAVRHQITAAGTNNTCSAGYVLYKLDDKVCQVSGGDRETSFCDEFGNTAKVLIRIIQIMQIVVPILVIVLTSIDIARIVIAGNIEEELPKKKKSIIIRLIITCVFFFLPLITRLFIAFINDKEIYEVDCLFTGNATASTNDENEDCIEIDATE